MKNMAIRDLKGKTGLEVIRYLPEVDWILREGVKKTTVRLNNLIFVHYEPKKPREEVDLYHHVECRKGIGKASLDFIKPDSERFF